MAQITAGRVVFGRKIAPAQYENKSAEVEIAFSITEGEDLGDTLDRAAVVAQKKVLQLLGLASSATSANPLASDTVAKEAKSFVALPEFVTKEPAANTNAEPEKKARAPRKPKETPAPAVAEEVWEDPKPEPITDAQLMDALRECAVSTKNNAEIRRLVDEAGGAKATRVSSIPVEKREGLLAALKQVQPLKNEADFG